MKHTVYIYKEHYGCNAQPVLYPFMAYESTMRFCRKISRNNMARVLKSKQIVCITHRITWRN